MVEYHLSEMLKTRNASDSRLILNVWRLSR